MKPKKNPQNSQKMLNNQKNSQKTRKFVFYNLRKFRKMKRNETEYVLIKSNKL
jgi:hypothetical protein